jgi:hypothetical protein
MALAGVLQIQLGGAVAGTTYDVVDVSGTAALGAQLWLAFANGFQTRVQASDIFTIVSAGTHLLVPLLVGRRATTRKLAFSP